MTPLDTVLADPRIARLARALAGHPGRVVLPDVPVRYAAIAATLRLGPSEPELLLIRRAEVERDPWSGHVACPGGRKEEADLDLSATAVREMREETGIDLARQGRMLGTLDDIHPRTPVLPPILVRPFVAVVGGQTAVVPSVEVADFTWVPFDALLDEANWGTAPVSTRALGVQVRPVFRHADYVVWGMTEYLLRQLVTRYRQAA